MNLTLRTLSILFVGTSAVVVLALAHVITDGDTVAALSAVLSATIGTHALSTKGGDPPNA